MGIEECPGMPKDIEKQRREEIRVAIRKQGKKSHSKVSYAFNANSFQSFYMVFVTNNLQIPLFNKHSQNRVKTHYVKT